MANNEDTLIREVEEELRRERMEQLWKQYGSYFLVMALAIIIGVGGFKFYQTRQLAAANTAGAAYEDEDDKPALPEAVWATRENMLAPGFDKKGYGRTRFGSPGLKK